MQYEARQLLEDLLETGIKQSCFSIASNYDQDMPTMKTALAIERTEGFLLGTYHMWLLIEDKEAADGVSSEIEDMVVRHKDTIESILTDIQDEKNKQETHTQESHTNVFDT